MKKRKPTTEHNYMLKILRMQRDGLLPAGIVGDIDVKHDDWCDVYRGGFCNCDCDVSLRAPKKP